MWFFYEYVAALDRDLSSENLSKLYTALILVLESVYTNPDTKKECSNTYEKYKRLYECKNSKLGKLIWE